jgi:uncharacterized membrane protein YfcA
MDQLLFITDPLFYLVAIPAVISIGIFLGLWIHRNVDDMLFYRLIITLLFITGVKLCYDGVTSLI